MFHYVGYERNIQPQQLENFVFRMAGQWSPSRHILSAHYESRKYGLVLFPLIWAKAVAIRFDKLQLPLLRQTGTPFA
jgi:hypothetical protein